MEEEHLEEEDACCCILQCHWDPLTRSPQVTLQDETHSYDGHGQECEGDLRVRNNRGREQEEEEAKRGKQRAGQAAAAAAAGEEEGGGGYYNIPPSPPSLHDELRENFGGTPDSLFDSFTASHLIHLGSSHLALVL